MGLISGFVVFMALFSGAANADEKEADTCLRTKIWAGYDENWAVRTATTASLSAEEHRVYLVTLYAGNEYKLVVCGDSNATNLDIVLHDAAGQELGRDVTSDREPVLLYTPPQTETYYVVVHAASVALGQKAGVAMAVTYR